MRSIILVDASIPVIEATVEMVRTLDAATNLCTAQHSDACMRALDPQKFDLVIIDHQSSRRNEFNILENVRSQSDGLPILMLLAPEDESLALNVMKSGATDYVVKTPYFPAALLATLRRTFEQYRMRRTLEARQRECEELKQSRQLKRQFLAKAGHSLRTPLVSLRIYAQYLASGRLGPLSNQQSEKIESILKSAERLTHCIEDIQRYERLESEEMDLVKTNFDLRDVLTESISSVTRACMDKGVTLSQSWPPEPILVCADRELMTEAMKDLLENAVSSTPPRGSISITVTCKDAGATVSVTDSGDGLTSEKLAALFELLTSSNHSDCGKTLGLSLAKRILELHGSKLELDSRPSAGTRVRFVIPKVDECPQREASSSTRIEYRRRTVLVVDDDDDNLACTRAVLEMAGYDVVGANGFHEAKEQLADGRVDAVLMDVEMNGTSGLETLKHLKHCPATSSLPVVMLSAHVEDKVRAEASRLGASGYVVKPFSPTKLLRELTNALATATPSFA